MQEFFQQLKQRYSFALALAAGLLYPFGFAPYSLYWLLPICVAVLLASWTGRTPRQAAANGFAFGFSAFLTGIYWVTISVHTFGGAPLVLALFLMLALVAFLAGYFALLGYLFRRFKRPLSSWSGLGLFASLWMLLEWVRGWFLSGFNWLSPGYATVDSVLVGYLPVGGMLMAGWVVAITAAAVAAMLLKPGKAVLVRLILVAMLWPLGLALIHVEWATDNENSLKVSLVQGSVPQEIKWKPDQLQPTIELYMGLSSKHIDSDLIVWPEAAIPLYQHLLEQLWSELERQGAATDTQFVVGTVEYDTQESVRYNSMTLFSGADQARQIYRKRQLVPFGEFFPVPGFIKERMRLMNLPYQNYSPGLNGQPPLNIGTEKVSASICYEDVFGHAMRDNVAQSSLLINVSNDAWFGGSLAPHQHLQIARTRAAELGRYLLRGTNNGISAIINRYGRVVDQSPQFEPYVVTAEVPGSQGITPYTVWGDWLTVVVCLICLLGAAFRGR